MADRTVLKPLGRVAATGVLLVVGLSACQVTSKGTDLINGKTQFIAKCGSCHTLAHANTKGTTGPNLDQAFIRSVEDGMKRSTIKGVVRRQIEEPNRRAQVDPQTGRPGAQMPKDLVTGDTAANVAAYVATVAGLGGQDTGRLADIGKATQKKTATESNGQIAIPVDSSGQLAFQVSSATGTAGQVKLVTKNEGTTDHNIALEGPGVNVKGPVVPQGGTSTVSASVKPGKYTFYCSVPGHREGGMVGTLTVK